MGKHAARSGLVRFTVLGLVLLGLPALVAGGLVLLRNDGWGGLEAGSCERKIKIVTAASFAPVLNTIAPGLSGADRCVRMDIVIADGRTAPDTVKQTHADLWIPDDTSWVGTAPTLELGRTGEDGATGPRGAGTVVAESPIYMITDAPTAAKVRAGGDSWLALATLLGNDPAVRMAVRDPGTSGDGMVGAGAMAETVWIKEDMDASALVLSQAFAKTRTVANGDAAMPEEPGEVGLVAEYALLQQLSKLPRGAAILSGKDYLVSLRYTWYPMAAALEDPTRAALLERLLNALQEPDAVAAIAAAGLRTPRGPSPNEAPPGAEVLPVLAKEPMVVLRPHHVDHVLATWYDEDRQTDLLVVVDVSGSMNSTIPGSTTPLMGLVRQGCRSLEELLPDDSRLGIWEFGVQLDPPRDYNVVLPPNSLTQSHRQATVDACGKLATRSDGTGLYDTILAAYLSAQDNYRKGVPNRVLVFTDGQNQDTGATITLAQLEQGLKDAQDEKRPVSMSVVVFGKGGPADQIEKALESVEGYVDTLTDAGEVPAVFIHVAAGGLHG